MSAPQTTQTPAITDAPNGKGSRKKLPPITKLFNSKDEVDKAQKEARDKGHSYDTRKFKVTANGKTAFCLAYSPANATGIAHEALGIQVEELDPSDRQPFQLSVDKIKERVKGLSEEDKKAIMDLLTPAKAETPKKK